MQAQSQTPASDIPLPEQEQTQRLSQSCYHSDKTPKKWKQYLRKRSAVGYLRRFGSGLLIYEMLQKNKRYSSKELSDTLFEHLHELYTRELKNPIVARIFRGCCQYIGECICFQNGKGSGFHFKLTDRHKNRKLSFCWECACNVIIMADTIRDPKEIESVGFASGSENFGKRGKEECVFVEEFKHWYPLSELTVSYPFCGVDLVFDSTGTFQEGNMVQG